MPSIIIFTPLIVKYILATIIIEAITHMKTPPPILSGLQDLIADVKTIIATIIAIAEITILIIPPFIVPRLNFFLSIFTLVCIFYNILSFHNAQS